MSWRLRMYMKPYTQLKQYRIMYTTDNNKINFLWNRSKIDYYFTIVDHHFNRKRYFSNEIRARKRCKTSSQLSHYLTLVCGQNICGQLGLSTSITEKRKPQLLNIVNKLTNINENIRYVCAGSMHSCAITVNGDVYTWGCNDDGALGRITNDIDDEYAPGLLLLPERVKTICAGDTFTMALTVSGRAYISGCFRSSEGILGLLHIKQISYQPLVISINQSIKQIACGADFCLLLTENGELYSFGNNETGQLGRDAHLEYDEFRSSLWLKPSLVHFFKEHSILDIWAGGHGFFVLTKDSSFHLFSCGANSFGQLGHTCQQPIYTPIEIKQFLYIENIVKIACGLQHTLILDSLGYVYGLGRSDDGRLGTNTSIDISVPKRIEELKNIIDIAAGGSVSFAIDNQRYCYSFGMGDTCQTGHGNQDIFKAERVMSKQLEQRQIEQISVGAQHTLFLAKDKFN